MATREGVAERARRQARVARTRLGGELRVARRGAGLSLAAVAVACRLSAAQVMRIERGGVKGPSLEAVTCIASVVGLDVAIRTYPAGDPIRDAGHARLLERFRQRLHPALAFRTEVPLPIPGDRRAWDAVVSGSGWRMAVEAETVIDDTQALERRLAIKLRDGGFDHLILLVGETRRNREVLRAAPPSLAEGATGRSILAALEGGRRPPGGGLLVL